VYDLLLLDVKMPKMNGFELYRHMSKTAFESYAEEFKTAFPDQSESCFIRKPISIDELAKRIKEQLLEESR
jgi:DNA-binding response OmpR family regulator